eukprot:gnl/Dysnectes_brevis/4772_a6573_530.p1 GENE.gnl/Dysnectes_brevis/4772_a6573_530~~gnl/Dysnectes_brevis/4772_a6573_530.p1  ORF type:complete len:169 (+),score=29.92 gnl/Dysnectes_brevis/4772_a6573_530:121-627(+)
MEPFDPFHRRTRQGPRKAQQKFYFNFSQDPQQQFEEEIQPEPIREPTPIPPTPEPSPEPADFSSRRRVRIFQSTPKLKAPRPEPSEEQLRTPPNTTPRGRDTQRPYNSVTHSPARAHARPDIPEAGKWIRGMTQTLDPVPFDEESYGPSLGSLKLKAARPARPSNVYF